MPFASTRVVHPDWAAHHRPVALGTMTGTCTITTATGGGWTPGGGGTPGTPTTLHTGPCVVSDLRRSPGVVDAAGQPVVEHPYTVGIDPAAVDIPSGAIVHIDTCPEDPRLVGKDLTVVSSSYDSLLLERVLVCDLA